MSSDELQEGPSIITQGWKKRRLQGACDTCRKKKVKCDSANMPGNRCSNCIAFNLECTHAEPPKKRGPKSTYVENLEKRVKNLEELLRKLSPGVNLDDLSSKENVVKSSPSPPLSNISAGSPLYPPTSSDSPSTTSTNQDDEDLAHVALSEHLKLLSLDAIEHRFFGESSGFMLMKSAHGVKSEFTGTNSFSSRHFKRPKYWVTQPWERRVERKPSYVFPEPDLLVHLISLYFEKVNAFLPILHAPSFKRNIAQGLHLRDHQFGATILLVCAVASRYSDDPRVLAVPGEELSCGWMWFDHVQNIRQSLFDIPTLNELQYYCLAILYLTGSSCPQASWTLVSVGIRFAQELGVHRRKPDDYKWTAEDEQKKRAFWVLVSLDRLISCFVGRPSSIRDEDFDVELPIEVDDEYWENPDPALAFKQPRDKPSVISCFVWHLKLCEILAFTLRTLYSTKKSKILLGLAGNDWEQTTVSELDSALNSWVNSIPEHLRWNPDRQDKLFFHQSAFLYIQYYHVQIQTHRPFLQKRSSLSFPSLAICTNAARACIHVVEVHARRGVVGLPHILNSCFTAGVVLLFNIWGSKRAGVKIDPQRELLDVEKLIKIFKACDRWTVNGRFCDILAELARDLNPSDHVTPSNKRARGSDIPVQVLHPNPHAAQQPTPTLLTEHLQQDTVAPETKVTPSSFDPYYAPSITQPQKHLVDDPHVAAGQQVGPSLDQYNMFYNLSVPVSSTLPDFPGPLIVKPKPTGLPSQAYTTDLKDLWVDPIPNETGAVFNDSQVHTGGHNFQSPDDVWIQTMDSNAMNIWMSAPVNFNFDDWGNYVERDMFSTTGSQSSGSSLGNTM